MAEPTDEQLMTAYQAGDENAFRQLYDRYSKRVYGYLSKKVKSKAQVDEVFQAVFMKLHQSRHLFEARYRFAPWLFTICRTVVIDAARTRKIFDEGRFERLKEQDLVTEAPGAPMEVDLSCLPAEQRQLLEMRYLTELNYDEIAAALRLTPQTVRKQVSRAVQRLRRLMTQ